ncbi:MAG: bifunctional phosphopantothenoylcysteine decarboxylase/phosphopantothenate--cysteine ligase CoaBC [Nitrospirota bacterium]|nr:bifunctional phosphopantothenoylcysteine decarboxylase/phosphopantothenate--cysteine ligase CoaBC [Nitrospirota bacterium]
MLSGKKILLGVSGSVAAYKAADILRRLMERGAEVRVVFSRNASQFIAPLTFSAISGRPVLHDDFSSSDWGSLGHIAVTDGLDLAIIAPATADILGKAAAGIADDALSTALLATNCPLLIAPAMNTRMYGNPIVQRNISTLRETGARIVEPETGMLACGVEGKGKLASAESIVDAAVKILAARCDLAGIKMIVTSGPTREYIDPVRFISNPSTGRMGHAIAAAARDRGAEVVLISGPTEQRAPDDILFLPVTTAAEMRQAVSERFPGCQVLIMAAAVSDFRPAVALSRKVKKDDAELVISLERTDDILKGVASEKGTRILVGFAAETHDLLNEAKRKREQKNLDLIVANEVGSAGTGFASETNKAVLIDRAGMVDALPLLTKQELAGKILDKVGELKANQGV